MITNMTIIGIIAIQHGILLTLRKKFVLWHIIPAIKKQRRQAARLNEPISPIKGTKPTNAEKAVTMTRFLLVNHSFFINIDKNRQ